MATVRIRHYRVRKGRGYWEPTARMKSAGFRLKALGLDGPEAWAEAQRLNGVWDQARSGKFAHESHDRGTLGWVFAEYQRMNAWAAKAPRTRTEWHLAWSRIRPIFADIPVHAIDMKACDTFYAGLAQRCTPHNRHRVFKIFRALLEVAVGMQLIVSNPTRTIANVAPKGRDQIWHEAEVARLREVAWERGFAGVALAIAIAYDTQLSPGDVIALTTAMRRQHQDGPYFETRRGKTKRKVYATLSSDTVELLDRYLSGLRFAVPMYQPFIRNRRGHAYNPNTLAKDFAKVREIAFPDDGRVLMDLRRSGNVEAVLGGAQPPQLSAKLANTIHHSSQLYDTYAPAQLDGVRQFDQARETFRRRKGNKSRKFTTSAPASESELSVQQNASAGQKRKTGRRVSGGPGGAT